ncbi:hypothetical protein SAMN05518801_10741 [Novosphingobium sp. CF614]|uniref:hypothetical protein n=1 Tax=Novosphingobium sp. CF614 TaxID=1884364 RepID=UPI0008EA78AF|nr:hypothetical protein [Novosphingobium sp. CF614]SFG08521.1 hypothetical protein SAMN05518801_10741 [Novosphingobium sp. CF614]
MSVIQQVFAKLKHAGGLRFLDASDIEETADAKVMTASERAITARFGAPSLSNPAIIGIDDNKNAWIYLTPSDFMWKPLADIKAVTDQLAPVAGGITSVTAATPTFSLADGAGAVWASFTPSECSYKPINDLQAVTDQLAPIAGGIKSVTAATPTFSLADGAGAVWASFTPSECSYKPINDLQADVAALQAGQESTMWAELYPVGQALHMIYYGQSLTAGRGAAAISTSPLAYAYRYVGGVAAQDNIGSSSSATNHASIVAHIETDMTDGGRGAFLYGETPAYGGAMMLHQLYAADGFDMGTDAPVLLSSVPAIGGQSLVNLMPGGASSGWTFLTDAIGYAPARCLADLSRAYGGLGLGWNQGQAEIGLGTPGETYKTNMISMRASAEALVQAAEGNTRPFPIFIAQVAAHPNYSVADPIIARAQLELCQEQAYFALACPDYIFTRQADGIHITATSELWMGAYQTLCAYRWCVKGEKPVPLVPTAQRLGARTIALTFPVASGRKLQWDTAIVAAQTNYGFTAVNTATSAALTITGVTIGGAGRVAYLTFSADLPAAAQIRYAWQSGDGKKGAGNLRDDDPLVFDPSGHNLPMHTWAPIFDLEV